MPAIGPYRLDAVVGRGTTGTVWRAVRTGPVPQVVAVKRIRILAAGERDRLRREAEVLAALDHPHIVRVIDVLDDGDDVAIVMALARGGSLDGLLAERGHLTAGEVVAVLAPVADALASAHRHGIVHGDVTPANILFTADGEPLLADFGTARLRRAEPGGDGERGTVSGTVGYVDPHLLATGRSDPTNDVYGLAAVAHRCLTGHLPPAGPALPAVLAEVIEAALAHDPALRPPSAAALAQALRASVPAGTAVLPGPASGPSLVGCFRTVAGAPGSASSGTREFGPRPPEVGAGPVRRRRRWAAVAVVTGVAAVVVAVVVLPGRMALQGGDGGSARDPVAARAPAGPAGQACPELPPIEVPPGAREIEADMSGRGCPVPAVWDGRVLVLRLAATDVEPRRYELAPRRGGAGQLVVGDWDCDGTQTPGYYQPATGRVSTFGALPERIGQELTARTEDTGVRGGRAKVVPGAGRCDVVTIVSPP